MSTKNIVKIALMVLCIGLTTEATAQSLPNTTSHNYKFFSAVDTKLDLNYSLDTRMGVKFRWNSNHLGTDLSDPQDYKYRTDYAIDMKRVGKLSFFAEGSAKKSLSLLDSDPAYNGVKNFGIVYGLKTGSLSMNVQYTQRISSNEAAPDNGKTLKVDISSKL